MMSLPNGTNGFAGMCFLFQCHVIHFQGNSKRSNRYAFLLVQTIKYLCLRTGSPKQYQLIPKISFDPVA